MWVDKYCVNQCNEKEKQKEIIKMKDYYSNSDAVIVWLHDIESNENMHKSEWLTRLWTLQEWELNDKKWILIGDNYITRYNKNKFNNLFPESRINMINLEKKNINDIYYWLKLANTLDSSKDNDKIFGILGMISYSKYIDFTGKYKKNDILLEIYNTSCAFNDDFEILICLDNKDIDNCIKELKINIINNIRKYNKETIKYISPYLSNGKLYFYGNKINFSFEDICNQDIQKIWIKNHYLRWESFRNDSYYDDSYLENSFLDKDIIKNLKEKKKIDLYFYNFYMFIIYNNFDLNSEIFISKLCNDYEDYSIKEEIGFVLTKKHEFVEIIGIYIYYKHYDDKVYNYMIENENIKLGYLNFNNHMFHI